MSTKPLLPFLTLCYIANIALQLRYALLPNQVTSVMFFPQNVSLITLSMPQARWAAAASQLLRTWRHQIDITVPWRGLYEFAHGFVRSSDFSYEGELSQHTLLKCNTSIPSLHSDVVQQLCQPNIFTAHMLS